MSLFLHRTGLAFAGATTVAFVTSTSSTAATISAPATVNAGDLLVLFDIAFGLSAPTNVVPSGFTQIITDDVGASRSTISYKIADGSEDGATITGMNSVSEVKNLLQFRADVPIESIAAQDLTMEATAGDPAAEVISASGGKTPMIILAYYGSDGLITPSFTGATPDGTVTNSGSQDNIVKHLSYNVGETPADVTIDMNDADDVNYLAGMYIELS